MTKKRFPWWILLVVPFWPFYLMAAIWAAVGALASKVADAIDEWQGGD